MNNEYKQLQRTVQNLVYAVKDAVDNPSDPTLRSIQSELERIQDDAETGKNPRSIESQVATVQRLLQQLRGAGDSAMDFNHIDSFYKQLEEVRRDLHQFDNY